MATNKHRVMVPSNMGKEGVDILRARGDIEVVVYPTAISQADLLPLLSDVSGIALSATPYRQAELDASPAMQVVARIGVGFDAVEIPALNARKIPLLTPGIANSTSVAQCAGCPAGQFLKPNEATCRPAEPVARFLVGPSRICRVVEAQQAELPPSTPPTEKPV